MAILYVAAEAAELEPFCKLLQGARKLKWPIDYAREGILEGRRVLLAANGAGPRLAARAVEVARRAIVAADLSSSSLDGIVSTGFCGALSSSLKETQIVIAESVWDNASGEQYACELPHAMLAGTASGVLIAQDRVANDVHEKAELAAKGAIAVDMESASVASAARRADIPFFAIKVVSDRATESFPFDLNSMRDAEGRIGRGKIVLHTLTRPHLLPELFRWKGRADKAARELGEFLANCRIKPGSDQQPLAV